ncbi:MAG TPA: protein kinase [Thermoanaerobaculia bacterium]
MALATGVRLGPYEIVAPLGAGGMGEVYRARDTRLDRTVAVKILPDEPSRSGELRARFEQEARAISSLNHPNICTLHDVGRHDGIDYLVMELLDGETLADRLMRGPLPLAQVIRYGAEVARALAQAHRRGIVHRDLKPGNIMLTPRGAKVLDFGLAKATDEAGGATLVSDALTRQKPVTAEGTLLGTIPYMAPEQVEGNAADARSDIFALGAILWEMATGKRAFGGKSRASVIASILEHEPEPVSALIPLSPPALDRLIRIALRKDPEARWQNADDVALELEAVAEEGERSPTGRRRWVAVAALAGILGIAIGALAGWRSGARRNGERQPLKLSFFPPEGEFIPLHRQNVLLAISPEGRRVAFVGGAGGGSRLWIHSLDTGANEILPGTEGAASPFWSPDGTAIGFYAAGMLRRVDLGTKSVQGICSVSKTGAVSDWGPDGTILFVENAGAPGIVKRVKATGGTPAAVGGRPTADPRTRWRNPEFLPDGKHFLAITNLIGPVRAVYVRSLDGTMSKRLIETDSKVLFAPPHWIVQVRDGVLVARRLDLDRLAVSGDPITLAPAVHYFKPTGAALFDVSETTLVYQSQAAANQLVWLGRDGSAAGVLGEIEGLQAPAISHDGASVAVSIPDSKAGFADVWVYDLRRGFRNRVTQRDRFESFPIWSPDDRRLVFSADRRGPPHLHTLDLASQKEAELTGADVIQVPTDWSHDGTRIAFTKISVERGADVWMLPLATRKPQLVAGGDADERDGRFSPDGRWIAFTSDDTGKAEIYVVAADRPLSRSRVSPAGGKGARWNGEGSEIFYINGQSELVSVPVTRRAESLEFGAPRVLTKLEGTRASSAEIDEDYSYDPVSGRFLLNRANTGRLSVPTEIVLDWNAKAR